MFKSVNLLGRLVHSRAILIPNSKKNAKLRFGQSKISFSIAKLHFFLQSITIYFAEQDHRLKIENVVVANQVLINVFRLLSHAGVILQRHPFFLFLINLSILSCRQIVDLESS